MHLIILRCSGIKQVSDKKVVTVSFNYGKYIYNNNDYI